MICAIMQPTYLPWLGYFSMIDQVDTFVFLDDVQLTKRSWQVRNKIKDANGELMLTVPIKKKRTREDTYINNAEPNDDISWRIQHIKSIMHCYQKTKFYDLVLPFFTEKILGYKGNLADFNIYIIINICKEIGINTNMKKSSEIDNKYGDKDLLLASICKSIGSKAYLSPKGSACYIEAKNPGGKIESNDIKLYYHSYEHPIYDQNKGRFIPYLSILDLLFNIGFENALEVIRSGNRRNQSCMEYGNTIIESRELL